MNNSFDPTDGWAGRPVHDQPFAEKYGESATSFGLIGRISMTAAAVFVALWLIWETLFAGVAAFVYGTAPAGAIYLLFILPPVLRETWKKNRPGAK